MKPREGDIRLGNKTWGQAIKRSAHVDRCQGRELKGKCSSEYVKTINLILFIYAFKYMENVRKD